MSESNTAREEKNKKKEDFLLSNDLEAERNAPLVIIDLRNLKDDIEWVPLLIEGLTDLRIPVVVLGKRSDFLVEVLVIEDETESKSVYEIADIAVLIDDNTAHAMEAWANGVVPICHKIPDASDYNPIEETGNAFVAPNAGIWGFFFAVVRALETYKFPYDWRHLVDLCRKQIQ